MTDDRLVSGWVLWLTWAFIVLTVAGVVTAVVVLLFGPQPVADALGVLVIIPTFSLTWALQQVGGIALATACVGVLLREIAWAKAAVVCAWSMAALDLVRSVEALVSRATLAIPFTIVLYVAFAIKLRNVIRQRERAVR